MMALLWISALLGLALGLYFRVWIVAPAAAVLATGVVAILAQSGQPLWAQLMYVLASLTASEWGYLVSSALSPARLRSANASGGGRR